MLLQCIIQPFPLIRNVLRTQVLGCGRCTPVITVVLHLIEVTFLLGSPRVECFSELQQKIMQYVPINHTPGAGSRVGTTVGTGLMETFVVIFQLGGIIWGQWGTGTSPLESPPRLFIRARLLSFWQRQGVSKTPSHYSGSDSIRNTSAGSRAWDRWEMELSTSRFQCVGSHLMSRHRRPPPPFHFALSH